jgi:hypothetical protein
MNEPIIFPNGFENWAETHYEVVSYIQSHLRHYMDDKSLIYDVYAKYGTGGMYELSIAWTNEFEEQNIGREWDGEFFDEVEEFCYTKNFKNNGKNV